jgi:hypothetical protein
VEYAAHLLHCHVHLQGLTQKYIRKKQKNVALSSSGETFQATGSLSSSVSHFQMMTVIIRLKSLDVYRNFVAVVGTIWELEENRFFFMLVNYFNSTSFEELPSLPWWQ